MQVSSSKRFALSAALDFARVSVHSEMRAAIPPARAPQYLLEIARNAFTQFTGGKFREGDRHQLRFIVAPADSAKLSDLKPFVRDLVRQMEQDLSTRLVSVAVDHFNTGHPA